MTSAGHEERVNSSKLEINSTRVAKIREESNGLVNTLPNSSSPDHPVDEHRKQKINDILEDLTADFSGQPAFAAHNNTNNSNHVSGPVVNSASVKPTLLQSSKSAEEIADAAQSLLLFQSGSVGDEDSDQILVKALLNLHQAEMAPPNVPIFTSQNDNSSLNHATMAKSVPSGSEKPVLLEGVSTSVPFSSENHRLASHGNANGTPELLEDLPVDELQALLPGLSGCDLAELHAVVPSTSGTGTSHDDLGSPTKAGLNFLQSIMSSSPTKSSQSKSAETHSEDPSTSVGSRYTFSKEGISALNNGLTEKSRYFSNPINVSGPNIADHVDSANLGVVRNDDRTVKDQAMAFYLPEESQEPDYVEVFNYRLPKVRSVSTADTDRDFVSIFDVFQNFFSKHHWDSFKGILEKNHVPIRSIQTVTGTGSVDALEVIEVMNLERLLLSNVARKDGFVKCLSLSSRSDGNIASTLINTREPEAAELSSGIRTRHGDHSDISYVMFEGKKICSLLVDSGAAQWVRLVDIQKRLLTPESPIVTVPQMNNIKEVCQELNIEIHRCASSQKHRMVVYGDSVRANTLACIDVRNLPTIMDVLKLKKERKSRKRSRSKEVDFESRSSSKRRRIDMSSNSSLYSEEMDSSDSSIVSSNEKDEEGVSDELSPESDDEFSESSVQDSVSRPGSAMSVDSRLSTASVKEARFKRFFNFQNFPLAMSFSKNSNTRGKSTDLSPLEESWSGESAETFGKPVCVPRQVDLKSDQEALGRVHPGLTALCRPASVALKRAPSLKVMVSNWAGARGPVGDYQDHLFLSENTPCVFCFQCRRHLSVRRFVSHSHDMEIVMPRLFLCFGGPWVRVELWERLQKKLARYKMADLLFELPDEFGYYYHQKKIYAKWQQAWKATRRSVFGTVQGDLSSLDTDMALEDWLDSKLEKLKQNPSSENFPKAIPHNPIEKNLCQIQNIRSNAFETVQRRNWHLDPLNFTLGGNYDVQKDIAIKSWFITPGEN